MRRRSLLKYGGLITAASMNPFCKRIVGSNSSKKLGVALVGLGYYSTNLLAPALKLTSHCELKGIVTGSPKKILIWQKEHGIKDDNVYNYENMHEIANNPEIDVIYIVVPTALHSKYAVIAANSGKHVWCEKPMAMTVDQCQDTIDACNKNKVKLCIGYRMLHEPNTQTLISYATSKPYGAMNSIDSQAGYRGGGGSDWRYIKKMGGGALYDMGVYTVNGIRYASGMTPLEVLSAKQSVARPEIMGDIDETTEYTLLLPNGHEAHGKTSVGEEFNHLRVLCEKGWYELRPMQSYNGVVGSTSDGTLLDVFVENQQALQMDDNALAIMNNEHVLAPGEEGLIDISIIEAIIKSSETGSSVKI